MAITGGTGFVGQCVVEKLLRRCPEIKKILILLRKKRNLSAHERVSQLVKLPVSCKIKFTCSRLEAEKLCYMLTS